MSNQLHQIKTLTYADSTYQIITTNGALDLFCQIKKMAQFLLLEATQIVLVY